MLPEIRRGILIQRMRNATGRLLSPLSSQLHRQLDDATWLKQFGKYDTENLLLQYHPFYKDTVTQYIPNKSDFSATSPDQPTSVHSATFAKAISAQREIPYDSRTSAASTQFNAEQVTSLFTRLQAVIDDLQLKSLGHEQDQSNIAEPIDQKSQRQDVSDRVSAWEIQNAHSEKKRLSSTPTNVKSKIKRASEHSRPATPSLPTHQQLQSADKNHVEIASARHHTHSNLSALLKHVDGLDTNNMSIELEPREYNEVEKKPYSVEGAKERLHNLTNALTPMPSKGYIVDGQHSHGALQADNSYVRQSHRVPADILISNDSGEKNRTHTTQPVLSHHVAPQHENGKFPSGNANGLPLPTSTALNSAAASSLTSYLNLPRRLSPDITETVADALNEYLQEQAMLHGVDIL